MTAEGVFARKNSENVNAANLNFWYIQAKNVLEKLNLFVLIDKK